MASKTAKPQRSPLDISIGGYVLTPRAKAAIKTLAANAARLDSRRRAVLGQASAAVGEVFDERKKTVSANLADAKARIGSGIERGQRWVEERPDTVRENLKPFLSNLDDYFDMVSKVDMTDASMLTPEQVRLREQAKVNRPRPDYNTPYYQDIRRRRERLHPIARQIDAGGRTFADTVMFGTPNYVQAAIDTAFNPYSYAQNLEGERYIDLLDSEDARAGQIVGRVAGSLVPTPGAGYVSAIKSLPTLGRDVVVEGGKAFMHDVIATPGDLEDRVGSGVKGALTEAMYAPLGALAGHGAEEVAPTVMRQYPFLEDVLSTLATTAPQELADAMADAESRRAPAR